MVYELTSFLVLLTWSSRLDDVLRFNFELRFIILGLAIPAYGVCSFLFKLSHECTFKAYERFS